MYEYKDTVEVEAARADYRLACEAVGAIVGIKAARVGYRNALQNALHPRRGIAPKSLRMGDAIITERDLRAARVSAAEAIKTWTDAVKAKEAAEATYDAAHMAASEAHVEA